MIVTTKVSITVVVIEQNNWSDENELSYIRKQAIQNALSRLRSRINTSDMQITGEPSVEYVLVGEDK